MSHGQNMTHVTYGFMTMAGAPQPRPSRRSDFRPSNGNLIDMLVFLHSPCLENMKRSWHWGPEQ